MYKLFLCFRYLKSKVLAYFAIIGVAVCVWMMVTAVSVMTGFLEQIEQAAKGLFGDVVIEAGGERGIGWYDEFLYALEHGPGPLDGQLTAELNPRREMGGPPYVFAGTLPAETVKPLKGLFRDKGMTLLPVRGQLVIDGENFGELTGLMNLYPDGRVRFRPRGRREDANRFQHIADLAQRNQVDQATLANLQLALPGPVKSIEAAGPFILSFGMIRVEDDPNFRQHVQIAGIRLPHRAVVTNFEDGLFVQPGWSQPTWTPPLDVVIKAVRDHQDDIVEIAKRELPEDPGAELTADQHILVRRINNALNLQAGALQRLRDAQGQADTLERLKTELASARKRNAPPTEIDSIQQSIDQLRESIGMEDEAHRLILGLGIPSLSFRTETGETIRFLVPGHRVILYVAPLGKGGSFKQIEPNVRAFTVVDDSHTDVNSIDSKLVYVPFHTLQELNNMGATYAVDNDEVVTPPRTSQLHLKVFNDRDISEVALRDIATEVRAAWEDFSAAYLPLPINERPATSEVSVETWRQRQSHVIGPVESQRILVIIILGIMSVVAVTLIFVILYTIVVQKTREIGVLKAVGASSWGVAGLFFQYGVFIGVMGSIIGTVGGYLTVTNINILQDWTRRQFDFVVFSPETHMFSRIPTTVDWPSAVMILCGSIVAGLVGALLPALRAARMQPAEAVRYE